MAPWASVFAPGNSSRPRGLHTWHLAALGGAWHVNTQHVPHAALVSFGIVDNVSHIYGPIFMHFDQFVDKFVSSSVKAPGQRLGTVRCIFHRDGRPHPQDVARGLGTGPNLRA
jgi:hypothetical protein